MKPVIVSEVIKAKKETVFDLSSNISNLANIISGITKIEMLSNGAIGIGTKWTETRVMFGKEASETMELSYFDRPNCYIAKAESHGSKYLTKFSFSEEEDGKTKITVTFTAEAFSILAKLMSIILGPLMKKSIINCLEKDLKDIKEHLEEN